MNFFIDLIVTRFSSVSGIKQFVKSKGMYNSSDELGTSLRDNNSKFVNPG